MECHTIMKIKMSRPYGAYKANERVEVDPGLATRLLAWGYAVEDRQQDLIETATVEHRAETADVNPKRRRKQA
jgi:hypothetical protein